MLHIITDARIPLLTDVSEKADSKTQRTELDLAGGRAAPVELLRRHLSSAPLAFLEGALDNPALTDSELILLLRNKQATAGLLLAIVRDRCWTRSQEVRKLLALHPRLPLAAARDLLPYLFWKQLAEISTSPQANPVVRRMAEEALEIKITEMSLGEKVALARQATARVIGALSKSAEPRLLRALLGNGRMREKEAAGIAADDRLPGELLAFIAGHHRWSALRSIRLALLANPRQGDGTRPAAAGEG